MLNFSPVLLKEKKKKFNDTVTDSWFGRLHSAPLWQVLGPQQWDFRIGERDGLNSKYSMGKQKLTAKEKSGEKNDSC